jgi:hypothetical protein
MRIGHFSGFGGLAGCNSSYCEIFGNNRVETTYFFEHGPMTNGVYQLMFDRTNVVAEITVNFNIRSLCACRFGPER